MFCFQNVLDKKTRTIIFRRREDLTTDLPQVVRHSHPLDKQQQSLQVIKEISLPSKFPYSRKPIALRGRKKLFRGHIRRSPIRGGGVDPPPALKRSTFFRQKVKNSGHALKNILIQTIFCIVTPSLSTGSNEIFI